MSFIRKTAVAGAVAAILALAVYGGWSLLTDDPPSSSATAAVDEVGVAPAVSAEPALEQSAAQDEMATLCAEHMAEMQPVMEQMMRDMMAAMMDGTSDGGMMDGGSDGGMMNDGMMGR